MTTVIVALDHDTCHSSGTAVDSEPGGRRCQTDRSDTASASSTRRRSSCDARGSPPPGCVTSSPRRAPPAARSSTTSRAARTSSSAEALEWSGSWAAERVVRHLSGMRRPSPSRLFTAMVDDWAADLRARDFERGCPVAGAVVDCADTNPAVRQAASAGPGDVAPADHRGARDDGPDPTARRDALDPHAVRARRGPRAGPGAARHRSRCASSPASSPRSSTPEPPRAPAVRCSRGHG